MCVHTLKEKQRDLSTPYLVHIQYVAVAEVKGEGHTVIICAAGMSVQVSMNVFEPCGCYCWRLRSVLFAAEVDGNSSPDAAEHSDVAGN